MRVPDLPVRRLHDQIGAVRHQHVDAIRTSRRRRRHRLREVRRTTAADRCQRRERRGERPRPWGVAPRPPTVWLPMNTTPARDGDGSGGGPWPTGAPLDPGPTTPETNEEGEGGTVATAASLASHTADVPPSATTRPGRRRATSSITVRGAGLHGCTSRSGTPSKDPAATPSANVSGTRDRDRGRPRREGRSGDRDDRADGIQARQPVGRPPRRYRDAAAEMWADTKCSSATAIMHTIPRNTCSAVLAAVHLRCPSASDRRSGRRLVLGDDFV